MQTDRYPYFLDENIQVFEQHDKIDEAKSLIDSMHGFWKYHDGLLTYVDISEFYELEDRFEGLFENIRRDIHKYKLQL